MITELNLPGWACLVPVWITGIIGASIVGWKWASTLRRCRLCSREFSEELCKECREGDGQ